MSSSLLMTSSFTSSRICSYVDYPIEHCFILTEINLLLYLFPFLSPFFLVQLCIPSEILQMSWSINKKTIKNQSYLSILYNTTWYLSSIFQILVKNHWYWHCQAGASNTNTMNFLFSTQSHDNFRYFYLYFFLN
jgi:hypothetical protein